MQQRETINNDIRERSSIPHGTQSSESPRRPGRARTDTMVFSDAAAVSEELARQGIFGHDRDREHDYEGPEHELSDEPEGEDENEEDGAAKVPLDTASGFLQQHDDKPSVDVTSDSELTGKSNQPKGEEKQESQPYTLTFSASGTMKGGWPPGVMTSTASSSKEEGSGGDGAGTVNTGAGAGIRLSPAPSLGYRGPNSGQSQEREREEPTFELILPDIDHVQPLEYAHAFSSSRSSENKAEGEGEEEGEGEGAVEGGEGGGEGGGAKANWDQELELDWGSDERIAELIARKAIIDAAAARREAGEEVSPPDEDKEGEEDEREREEEGSDARQSHLDEGGPTDEHDGGAKEEAAIASSISVAPASAENERQEGESSPVQEGEQEDVQEDKEKDVDVVDARTRTGSSGSSEFVIVTNSDADAKTKETVRVIPSPLRKIKHSY